MQKETQLVAPEPGDAGRLQRGKVIAARLRITKNKDGSYRVPSQEPKSGTAPSYTVNVDGSQSTCTCPDFEARNRPCKHIIAVWLQIQGDELETDEPGEAEIEVRPARKTYGQNWSAYDAAQEHELEHFEILLRQLCDAVIQPDHVNGRPRLPVSDLTFCLALKVYYGTSRRRVITPIRRAHERGLLDCVPSDASLSKYLGDEDLTAPLKYLIQQSSLPLRALEHTFGTDSTGISTASYERWFDYKWKKQKSRAKYLKLHLTCGVATKIITDADVTNEGSNDTIFLLPHLRTTVENFDVREWVADKAYLSKGNYEGADAAGIDLYVPFKVNSRSRHPKRRRSNAWEQAYHYFHYHRDEFLQRYHQRSITESVVNMVKAKFGASVRSKSEVAQRNEILLKCLGHNITVLIRTAYELGVQAELGKWLSDPATAPQGGPDFDDRAIAIAP